MSDGEVYRHDMTMMLAFHDALRRELDHVTRVAAIRTDDPRHVMATAVGWQMFKTYLHVHHRCEDDLLWPVMENAKRIGPEASRVFPWMLDGLDEAKTRHILSLIPEQVRALYANQWLGAYRQLDRWGSAPTSPERVS